LIDLELKPILRAELHFKEILMKGLFASLLLSFSISAHAEDLLSLDVHVNDPTFVISLPANPTTGFQWSVEQYDKNILTLSSNVYEKPKTNLVGAGGQAHFTFSLKKGKQFPEHTQLQFKYARSWEPKTGTVKKVQVNFLK
jgi:inhibitor of cysteine peptidase